MTNEQISLLSNIGLVAIPVMLAVRYLPVGRLVDAAKRIGGGATELITDDGELTIDEAYDALLTVEQWGAGKDPAYQEGVKLIRDHWLQEADPAPQPAEPVDETV